MRKALFLDRDGTICKGMPRGQYLVRLEEFEILEDALPLIKLAKQKNYLVILITNQPQIAKGLLKEEDLRIIHDRMEKDLESRLDAVYYCPHKNEDNCECRKPKPGMLFRAKEEFDIDLENSWMVGDSDKDVLAGQTAGTKTIFLRNEFNSHEEERCRPDFFVDNLKDVDKII